MGVAGCSCSGLLVAEVELVPFVAGGESGSVRLVGVTWNQCIKQGIRAQITASKHNAGNLHTSLLSTSFT